MGATAGGQLGEALSCSRGLKAPGYARNLRYHPELDYDSRRGWPGWLPIPRLPNGEKQSVGIHRTFLLD